MERKSHYEVLGVVCTESEGGIRAAYRDLAKKLVSSNAGGHPASELEEVVEACRVLGDPLRRSEYDDDLGFPPRGEPPARERLSILGSPEGIRPSYEAMRERFSRNFTSVGVPKSEHLEALNVDVLLSPEEAARGCFVPVGVPVFTPCPHCAGTGRDWVFPCAYCLEQGVVEGEACVHVRIPPMATGGSTYEVPLDGLGIHNFFLRLHVVV